MKTHFRVVTASDSVRLHQLVTDKRVTCQVSTNQDVLEFVRSRISYACVSDIFNNQ